MKNKILIYLTIIFSCFFVFKSEVFAESCSWPNCCEYRLKAGLTKEIHVKLDVSEYGISAVATHGGQNFIEHNIKYKKIKFKDVKKSNSCPEKVFFKDTSKLGVHTCSIYIVSPEYYSSMDIQSVPLVKPATKEEKKNIDANLQRHANTIEE